MSDYDVIIVGGGPAGTSAALHLARCNRRVLLLERETFPRFHIGESMVPYIVKLFEKLGIRERVESYRTKSGAPFVVKPGIEAISDDGEFRRISFGLMAKGVIPYSFNLDRTEFDQLLLDIAIERGADVRQNVTVQSFLQEGDRIVGVRAVEKDGTEREFRAKYVIDASGRAGLITTKLLRSRRYNTRLRNVALFRHFHNATKDHVPANGDIGDVVLANSGPNGWIWGIQISPTVLSVGVVVNAKLMQGSSPQKVFDEWLAGCPRLVERTREATPSQDEVRVETDYSYHSDRLAGPGWFVAGDAGCFVDPMFSGGCYLTMSAGLKAAEVIVDILESGRDEVEARSWFERFVKTGYDSNYRLLYMLYDLAGGSLVKHFEPARGADGQPTPPSPWKIQFAAGDFWPDEDHPLLSELRKRRDWDTYEPFEYVYGCPYYKGIAYSPSNPPGPEFFGLVRKFGIRFFDANAKETEPPFAKALKEMMMKQGGAPPGAPPA